MVKIGYHGTNTKIEEWSLAHLGGGQGQSVYPGIYFTDSYSSALSYAKLAVEKKGGEPQVYIAECELSKPLHLNKGSKLFGSFRDIVNFTREYFPSWFDDKGELHSYKVGYVKEKLSTYSGQYSFIRYAADESGLPLIEVTSELGFDSCIDGQDFVITNPNQILSFQEVDHELTNSEIENREIPSEEELEEASLASAFETTSNTYISSAKRGKPYKTKPGNRFLRRVYIKMNGGNNIWFDIDMNRLFKKGSFALKIPVVGETAEYVNTIAFDEWLPKLKEDIAKFGFTQMTVKRSLMEMLRFKDLKLKCSCPDFKYRHAYWLTVHNEIEGDPETMPSDETNPKDDLGKICKHLSFSLNNKIWADKESRIIYNYFINLQRTQRLLFDKTIAPKLGLKTKAEEEEAKKVVEEPVEDMGAFEPEVIEETTGEEEEGEGNE